MNVPCSRWTAFEERNGQADIEHTLRMHPLSKKLSRAYRQNSGALRRAGRQATRRESQGPGITTTACVQEVWDTEAEKQKAKSAAIERSIAGGKHVQSFWAPRPDPGRPPRAEEAEGTIGAYDSRLTPLHASLFAPSENGCLSLRVRSNTHSTSPCLLPMIVHFHSVSQLLP